MRSEDNMGCAPQLIENAQQALGRLHQNQLFADWRIYGDALVMLQAEAMHLAKTNQPKRSPLLLRNRFASERAPPRHCQQIHSLAVGGGDETSSRY